MATKKRVDRLNSLIKEVLSEVVREDVRHPRVAPLTTITRVDVSADLHHAKVYVSVIGTETEREETVIALQSAAGFIAVHASKKVRMRYFPDLVFKLDHSVEHHIRIETILEKIHKEEETRHPSSLDDHTANE